MEERKKIEVAKKKKLDESNKPCNLAKHAVAAQAEMAKKTVQKQKEKVRLLYKQATEPKKRQPEKSNVASAPKKKTKTNKETVKKARTTRIKEADKAPQGERKVPSASDGHGCVHSGVLELRTIDRVYLQAYVKENGWLYQMPCKDCAKKKEGPGGDKGVMEVSSLLDLRGKQQLGVFCNCGPVGHKMVEEDDPVRKKQWTCDMFLCMECFNKRINGMGDAGGGRRTRRQEK